MVALPDAQQVQKLGARSWRFLRFWLRRAILWLLDWVPKGLYARTLLIFITPIVLLESVVAFVFMERHWEAVTRRLSEATAGDVAALVDVYENYNATDNYRALTELARQRFRMSLQILPAGDLPPVRAKPFFDLLDRTLSDEIRKQINKPFWIDTVGRSNHVEIRIRLPDSVLRMVARRNQTYASNSHIFLVWMVLTSLVLLTVAIAFLRNQIKPILRLAEAADAFGKGRPVPEDFRPRGAREVRQAAVAFTEMRDRIERSLEQRTTMLAGVSHDLRTVLARFRLQLAILGEGPDIDSMRADIDEMQRMLDDYMAFARGGSGEAAAPVDIRDLLEEIRTDAMWSGKSIVLHVRRRQRKPVSLRRHAFKRTVANLVNNAVRYGNNINIRARQDRKWLEISVEDDGPGIPPEMRDDVFRPFFRADAARNQDEGNSGLGLSIARDIARIHGGDIFLSESRLGGLKATLRVPV